MVSKIIWLPSLVWPAWCPLGLLQAVTPLPSATECTWGSLTPHCTTRAPVPPFPFLLMCIPKTTNTSHTLSSAVLSVLHRKDPVLNTALSALRVRTSYTHASLLSALLPSICQ
jgi:hypothetical protein